MSSEILCGKKVYLQPVSDEDFLKMLEWGNDPELRYLMGQWKEDMEDVDWYKRLKDGKTSQMFAIYTSDDGLIGDIELINITWRNHQAELIIRIGDKRYWGQGYGTDAIILILQYAFMELKLQEVYLRVHNYNRRAIRCYEKCGFKKEGVLRFKNYRGRKGYSIILMNVLRHEFLTHFAFRLEA